MTARTFIPALPTIRKRLGALLRNAQPVAHDNPALRSGLAPGTLVFRCNVCSAACALPVSALEREQGNCGECGANMRSRSVIHHLSLGLFGRSLPIREFHPEAADLKGVGMSDSHDYASRLVDKLRYTNTFYHTEPRLDVQAPAPAHIAAYDFVISSDVFEHVDPPVDRALSNLRQLLKMGGLLVFTVPFATEGDTVEHFPDLLDYSIEDRDGTFVLINRTHDGRRQEYSNLVFHGGPGSTLELRLFSRIGLMRELTLAGFSQITFHLEPCFEHGIHWNAPWSIPITAVAA